MLILNILLLLCVLCIKPGNRQAWHACLIDLGRNLSHLSCVVVITSLELLIIIKGLQEVEFACWSFALVQHLMRLVQRLVWSRVIVIKQRSLSVEMCLILYICLVDFLAILASLERKWTDWPLFVNRELLVYEVLQHATVDLKGQFCIVIFALFIRLFNFFNLNARH